MKFMGYSHLQATPHTLEPADLKISKRWVHSCSCAPKPEGVTNAGNKTQQRTARCSAARLPLALTVRDVTLIWGRESGGSVPYGFKRKRGKGAEKLTLDISHLNAVGAPQASAWSSPPSLSSCRFQQMGRECAAWGSFGSVSVCICPHPPPFL